MDGVYWYVSRQKVEALRDRYGKPWMSFLKEISFKLKTPFAEANASIAVDETVFRDVERIEKNLEASGRVQCFPEVGVTDPVVFFSFAGPAHRTIDQEAYWIAMLSHSTALLLVGSATNAIGAPAKNDNRFSPTADPITAAMHAFRENQSAEIARSISFGLTYAWAEIAEPVGRSWNDLPQVQGIAVYAGKFPSDRTMLREPFENIVSIVVGSPIFVRQN